MSDKEERIRIYINLLNEGLEVKRPVRARKISDKFYEILDIDYLPSVETWEFIPGDIVECRRNSDEKNGDLCLAFRKVGRV